MLIADEKANGSGHVCMKKKHTCVPSRPYLLFAKAKPSPEMVFKKKEESNGNFRSLNSTLNQIIHLRSLQLFRLFPSCFRFNRFASDFSSETPGCKAQPVTCYVINGFYLFAALPTSRVFLFYGASTNTRFPLRFQLFPSLLMMIAAISALYIPFCVSTSTSSHMASGFRPSFCPS